MVKIVIVLPNGTFQERNTAAILIADPDIGIAFRDAWDYYMRSATVFVNDQRVFLNKTSAGVFTLATQINDSDAQPWQRLIQDAEDGAIDGPGTPLPPGPGPSPGPLPTPLPGQSIVYRMVLETSPGRVDTGASYPGCSRSNSTACQPMQFASIQDAVEYAYAHGEIPYRVFTAEESWQTIEGILPIDTARILAPVGPEPGSGGIFSGSTAILLIGAGLLLLAGRGTK